MRNLKAFSRDNSRTPMQWSRSQNAGFTEGTPWISVNSNHLTVNVEAQNADPASVLNHFRRMTALRKQTLTLIYGDYTLLVPEHESLYVYTRSLEEEKLLIALNFSDKKCNLEISSLNLSMEVLINNYPELSLAGDLVVLAPYQAVIIK
jgi:oligo-1,6-glucosidase